MSQISLAIQNRDSVIKGKVRGESGEPLAGAAVSVEGTFLGTYSNTDGSYLLEGLSDGVYRLRFSFIGYETKIVEVELKGLTEYDIQLPGDHFWQER
jgi:hypothetical protein